MPDTSVEMGHAMWGSRRQEDIKKSYEKKSRESRGKITEISQLFGRNFQAENVAETSRQKLFHIIYMRATGPSVCTVARRRAWAVGPAPGREHRVFACACAGPCGLWPDSTIGLSHGAGGQRDGLTCGLKPLPRARAACAARPQKLGDVWCSAMIMLNC